MAEPDLEKFIKLMMMTTSSYDQEALIALRKAQAMLAASNQNWDEFLRKKITVVTPSAQPSYGGARKMSKTPEQIERKLDELFARINVNSSIYQFISSISEWWEEKGFLTEKQIAALWKIY